MVKFKQITIFTWYVTNILDGNVWFTMFLLHVICYLNERPLDNLSPSEYNYYNKLKTFTHQQSFT